MMRAYQEDLPVPAAQPQTRDAALKVINRLISLRWRGIKAEDIPVIQMQDRIAVLLPSEKFTHDEQIRLGGKFQHLMTQAGMHAYLDFPRDWRGAATTLEGGFN